MSITLATICAEGLKRAGYTTNSSDYSTKLSRAQTQWIEEIKNDIYNTEKRLNALISHAYSVTVNGQMVYSMPADFGQDMSMELMDGVHYDTAQAGTDNTITLASTEDISESSIVGKEILLYSGTGSPDARQVISYNESTKVATVHADWTVNPDSTTKYMIISVYTNLIQAPVWDIDSIESQTIQGLPRFYAPIADDQYGRFYLFPVPYRSSGIPYGLKMRYYADLTAIDTSGTLMSNIYRKFHSLFVQGIKALALDDLDDHRSVVEMNKYYNQLRAAITNDKFGNSLSTLQLQVSDY